MEVLAGMPGDGDAPLFRGMLVVPMAAFLSDRIPTVGFDELDHVPDLHEPLYIFDVNQNEPITASRGAGPRLLFQTRLPVQHHGERRGGGFLRLQVQEKALPVRSHIVLMTDSGDPGPGGDYIGFEQRCRCACLEG